MFDRVKCVNLNRRPERWKLFVDNLPEDWPFKEVERYSAVDCKKVKPPRWWTAGAPAWGCYKSHLNLIEQALNEGIDSILLLEDDALFVPDFTKLWKEYVLQLPSDWGMIYFGGQNLKTKKKAPVRINQKWFMPYNVNRTHAFALRMPLMMEVYRHLCNTTNWLQGHHIDHHLGRFHQRQANPIYIPDQWLCGQMANKSDIANREWDEDRYWVSASDIPSMQSLFVPVFGLHASGSSCLAMVLNHLGVHMGNKFAYRPDSGEAVGIAKLMEAAFPFPRNKREMRSCQFRRKLNNWIVSKTREARRSNRLAGCKYPLMLEFAHEFWEICGEAMRPIFINRELGKSIKSLQAREDSRYSKKVIERHQSYLFKKKQQFLKQYTGEVLQIEYADLIDKSLDTIKRICDFLEISPSDEQVELALSHINPDKVNHGT